MLRRCPQKDLPIHAVPKPWIRSSAAIGCHEQAGLLARRRAAGCDRVAGGSTGRPATVQTRHDQGRCRRASSLTAAELRLPPLLCTHLLFREIGERWLSPRTRPGYRTYTGCRKLRVSSGSGAVASRHQLGVDTRGGPGQGLRGSQLPGARISYRSHDAQAGRLAFGGCGGEAPPWRPGMVARLVAQRVISNGQRPDDRWPGEGAGRPDGNRCCRAGGGPARAPAVSASAPTPPHPPRVIWRSGLFRPYARQQEFDVVADDRSWRLR